LICYCDGYRFDVCCTLCVVKFDDHLHHLTWGKTIFSKRHPWSCDTFIETAAARNSTIRFFDMTLNWSGLSKNDLSSSLNLELRWKRLDRSHHMIANNSFFCWCIVVKTGRPSLESFEAEGERVLPWGEATTLMYHDFASCELVPRLIIVHLKVTIGRCFDILWSSIVEVHIVFWLAIWDPKILFWNNATSENTSSCGGMAAMGSNWGGGGGWPGRWYCGAGRRSSCAWAHLTH